jgi:hypothetical protein
VPLDQVFISYSHEDKKWREDLEKRLRPYLRVGSIKSWSDEEIIPGSKWFGKIKAALADTKVAVLLVTPDFLASDFIHQHELGPLLKEAEQGGVQILWIPVRASAYQETPLRNYQAVIDPRTPLARMTTARRDDAWLIICKEIINAANPSTEPFPEDSLKDDAAQSAQQIPSQVKAVAEQSGSIELTVSNADKTDGFTFAVVMEDSRGKVMEETIAGGKKWVCLGLAPGQYKATVVATVSGKQTRTAVVLTVKPQEVASAEVSLPL